MNKKEVKTTKIQGGAEYARVAERLKAFREDCPNGSINTKYEFLDNGMVAFKSYVLKDKSDPNSADATGHSFGETKNKKEFEKLETIATGRALALLGYLASGEIASSEEMEEFIKFNRESLTRYADMLRAVKSEDELQKVWADLPALAKKELLNIAKEVKASYAN